MATANLMFHKVLLKHQTSPLFSEAETRSFGWSWMRNPAEDYDIGKRDKYLVCRYKDEYTKQSWLIYSGRTDNIPRIEFDPTCKNDGSWGERCYVNFGHNNKGYIWDGGNGIAGKYKHDMRLVGHVRANAVNDSDNAVFLEFAQGQIATARRLLGLAQ